MEKTDLTNKRDIIVEDLIQSIIAYIDKYVEDITTRYNYIMMKDKQNYDGETDLKISTIAFEITKIDLTSGHISSYIDKEIYVCVLCWKSRGVSLNIDPHDIIKEVGKRWFGRAGEVNGDSARANIKQLIVNIDFARKIINSPDRTLDQITDSFNKIKQTLSVVMMQMRKFYVVVKMYHEPDEESSIKI